MLFVSRKKYNILEERYVKLRDLKVAGDLTIEKLEMDLNDKTNQCEALAHELEVHKNRSESAYNRERNKRAKRIKEYEDKIAMLEKETADKKKLNIRIKQLESDNETLTALNDKYLADMRKFKNEYEKAEKLVLQLTESIENERKKPTVEELKWEKVKVDKTKLKGTKKDKSKKVAKK